MLCLIGQALHEIFRIDKNRIVYCNKDEGCRDKYDWYFSEKGTPVCFTRKKRGDKDQDEKEHTFIL